ncbi:DUF4345 domain-containing protein [Nonomuraea sp. NPDC052129]|uniref:DUF4345 domain-containing protein n=1 Tax=Nonomuraea sp. NPDC052129 TaxID=3154651 RepID=UPI0034333776
MCGEEPCAARVLRIPTQLMGWTSVAIGLFHVALGNAAIPGAGSAGTTVDSWGPFMGAGFVGYGLAWLWAARQRPIPARAVRWPAGAEERPRVATWRPCPPGDERA